MVSILDPRNPHYPADDTQLSERLWSYRIALEMAIIEAKTEGKRVRHFRYE